MDKVKTTDKDERSGEILAQLGTMLNGRYGTHSMASITYSIRYLNELRTDLAKLIKLSELVSQLMDVHPMTDEPRAVARAGTMVRRVSLSKRTEYFLSSTQLRELARVISSTVSEIAHVSKQLQHDAEKLEGLIKKQV